MKLGAMQSHDHTVHSYVYVTSVSLMALQSGSCQPVETVQSRRGDLENMLPTPNSPWCSESSIHDYSSLSKCAPGKAEEFQKQTIEGFKGEIWCSSVVRGRRELLVGKSGRKCDA